MDESSAPTTSPTNRLESTVTLLLERLDGLEQDNLRLRKQLQTQELTCEAQSRKLLRAKEAIADIIHSIRTNND